MKIISKDDYLLRNISKIKHKKWELYIITRILHSLNDSEIEYTCQQFVKTKSGKIVELAVRQVINGEKINNKEAIANPESLEFFANLPQLKF